MDPPGPRGMRRVREPHRSLHPYGIFFTADRKISLAPFGPEIFKFNDSGVFVLDGSKEKKGQHLFSLLTQFASCISRSGDFSKTKVKPSSCSTTCVACCKSDFVRAKCSIRSLMLKTVRSQAIGVSPGADLVALSPHSHTDNLIRRAIMNRPAIAKPLTPATVSASFGVQNKELATPAPTIHKKIGAEQMATQVPKTNAVPSHRRF